MGASTELHRLGVSLSHPWAELINSENMYTATVACGQGRSSKHGGEVKKGVKRSGSFREVEWGHASSFFPTLFTPGKLLISSPMFPSRSLFPTSSSLWCDSPLLIPMFHILVFLLSSQVPNNWQITGRGPAPSERETVNLGPRPGKTARKESQRKSYCCW